jgi:hypothetical protein
MLAFEEFIFDKNLNQQRELFCSSFPETDGDIIQSKDYYFWKFHSFPEMIKSWEFSSSIENNLVGYYAAIPYRYNIGSKITTIGMVCDVMTSPDYRGKGIFTKLGGYSTDKLVGKASFLTGYPIRKEVIPGHLKIGWEIPFYLPLYMKFIRFNTFLTQRKVGFFVPIANLFCSIYNWLLKDNFNKNYTYSLYNSIENVPGYDSFIEQWSRSVRNTLMKNLKFAKWRYGAPGRMYTFISIQKESKMIGFVSYRKFIKRGILSFGILDYMVLPEYNDCHGLINRILFDQSIKEKAELIMTMMSKTSSKKYRLIKNGFIKSPFKFSLIIKNLSDEFSKNDLYDERNWHLMWIDSDDL